MGDGSLLFFFILSKVVDPRYISRSIFLTRSGEIKQCQSVNSCKRSWTVDYLNFVKNKILYSGNLFALKCN